MNVDANCVAYEDLDPGIREVVRWLNESGFVTTDSGDGQTKFAELDDQGLPAWDHDELIATPHVVVRVGDPLGLIMVADALQGLIDPFEDGPYVEACYDPRSQTAMVILFGLDDAMLTRRR